MKKALFVLLTILIFSCSPEEEAPQDNEIQVEAPRETPQEEPQAQEEQPLRQAEEPVPSLIGEYDSSMLQEGQKIMYLYDSMMSAPIQEGRGGSIDVMYGLELRFTVGASSVIQRFYDSSMVLLDTRVEEFTPRDVDPEYNDVTSLPIEFPSKMPLGPCFVAFQVVYPGGYVNSAHWQIVRYEPEMAVAKPIIYLYPEETMDVSVRVIPSTPFTVTDPNHGAGGWTVAASPDGSLLNHSDGKNYPYLFWESEYSGGMEIHEGFTVAQADLENFFGEKLEYLGMNGNEIDDFLEFWLEVMDQKLWYQIRFLEGWEIEEEAELVVNPAPDSVLRVYFCYKGMNRFEPLPAQHLTPGQRQGFTLVEWGGYLDQQ